MKQIATRYELIKFKEQEDNMIESIRDQGIIPNPTKAQLYLIKEKLEN